MRVCDYCAGPIEPGKPRTTKYCSPECRTANAQQPRREPTVTHLPGGDEPVTDPLVEAVRQELTEAGRLDTVLGRQAVALAERMGDASGAAMAALSKELRTVMGTATQGVTSQADPVDELRLRRDRKSG
ncbi:hypothetical protein OG874_00485 [Nocardia sp. NBC_00565]|uniref:hypothetical protein n=1 Tax=Nocardia sp. NBC_00565 TaxID=2975993 RepID=UPI002E7FFAB0|nr:hypothetical protein [Nocardia sp. NBC_00565]WUC03732.1 hypothetical protein OG874_00485 [Nocardia sp. NBC_00565]